jgi:KaiC/GvpD/RAD55 family RecA-like ATPase
MGPDPMDRQDQLEASSQPSVPSELLSFFKENVGEILLVKGPPGSGKTLLSLACMKSLCRSKRGIVIFTRMDKEQVATEMGWIKDEGSRGNLLVFNSGDKIADPNWFKREFEQIMDDKAGLPLGFVLFDTIDAITEQFDNPQRKVKEIVSLVQKTNVSAIMVQEDEGITYLDHLAGGVVRIDFGEIDGRRYRSLRIDKLRGVEIEHATYLMTLHMGSFRSFGPWDPLSVEQGRWMPLPDRDEEFSTGVDDLDRILGGGYRKGSYNILDLDDNISTEEYMMVTRPVLLNFIHHDYGILMVPPAGEHPEALRADLERFVGPKRIEGKVFFLDYFSASSNKQYIIPMAVGKKEGASAKGLELIQNIRGPDNKPYLDFVGLDTMEYLMGESISLKQLLTGVSKAKVTKTLGMGLSKPGLKTSQGIKNMADVFIRMIKINNIPCIYGIKPQTGIYAILPHPKLKFPNLSLIPLT